MADLDLTAAIEAAARWFYTDLADEQHGPWDHIPERNRAYWLEQARRGIEAAAPLIRADERAKVAEELRAWADRWESGGWSAYAVAMKEAAACVAEGWTTEVTG